MDIQSIGLNTFVVVVVFARHEPNVTELNHDRSLGHILDHILDPTLNESRERWSHKRGQTAAWLAIFSCVSFENTSKKGVSPE